MAKSRIDVFQYVGVVGRETLLDERVLTVRLDVLRYEGEDFFAGRKHGHFQRVHETFPVLRLEGSLVDRLREVVLLSDILL